MSEKDINKHEYIAAIIFFSFLCLPLLAAFFPYIEPALPEINEKRALAKFPGLPEVNIYKLKSYPQKYEQYFNDHFGFRKLFLRSLALYRFHFFSGSISSDVMIGKENWLFANRSNTLDAYRGYEWFSQNDLIKIKKFLEKKKSLLAQRGIDYLYVIAPNKHSIYPEYFPASFIAHGENYVDTFVKYMRDNSDVDILDLRHSLISNKNKGQLYYRTDTHWNSLGAYYAYREIIKKLQKKHPSIKLVNIEQLENTIEKNYSGDITDLMGLRGALTETVTNLKLKNTTALITLNDKTINHLITSNTDLSGPRVLMFRDSFTIYLQPFLSESFSFVKYIWTGYWPVEKELLSQLDQVKPTIVIEERVENEVRAMRNIVNMDSQKYLR